jgi:hypothetical protein
VIKQPAREHRPLHVTPAANHFRPIAVMTNPDHILFNDRFFLKIFCDVMAGCANQFDASIKGALVSEMNSIAEWER